MRLERYGERVDVLFRRFGAETDAQNTRGGLFVKTHRAVDMAQLSAVTGRAGGNADALRAKLCDDIGRRIADERDGQNVRCLSVADADNTAEGEQRFFGIGLDGCHVRERFIEMLTSQFDRLGKACDLARSLRAGAKPLLLPAAIDERLRRAHAPAEVQSADPLARRPYAR